MRRFAITVTILCFFVISGFQSSICCLCVPVGHERGATDAVIEPEEAECESCCLTENACAEPKCVLVGSQAPSTCSDSSESCEKLTNTCNCEYVVLHLAAVLEQRRNPVPETPDGNSVPSNISLTDSRINLFHNCSRPQGVHPIISTTVLRC
jgi:hypothetical protein